MEFMPEFTLSFQPPLTIMNCLPSDIMVTLMDANSKPQQFSIDVGASIQVYNYDLSCKIHMAMQLQVRCSINPYCLVLVTHGMSLCSASCD